MDQESYYPHLHVAERRYQTGNSLDSEEQVERLVRRSKL